MVWSQVFDMPPFISFLPGKVPDRIPVTTLIDEAELVDVQIHSESFPPANDPSKEVTLMNKFPLKLPPSLYLPFLVINILHPSRLRQSHLLSLSRPDTPPLACFLFYDHGSYEQLSKNKIKIKYFRWYICFKCFFSWFFFSHSPLLLFSLSLSGINCFKIIFYS